jgi:hypothetical protein
MVVMTIAWLGVLVAIDYAKNPRLREQVMTPAKLERAVSLWINHLCCEGCLGQVRDALVTIPWIDPQRIRPREHVMSNEQAEAAGPIADDGGWVDVGVADFKGLDFVEIDRALREQGMVASRIEFGGPRHFRLDARVRCCGMCQQAVDRILTLDRARPIPRLRWVDSVTTDRAGQRVTVHARYQDPGDVVDVADLLGAFDGAGLPAFSLLVLEEGQEAPAPEGGHDPSGHEPSPHGAPGHTH